MMPDALFSFQDINKIAANLWGKFYDRRLDQNKQKLPKIL